MPNRAIRFGTWLRNFVSKINLEIFEFDYQGKHIVLLRIPSAKGEPKISENLLSE